MRDRAMYCCVFPVAFLALAGCAPMQAEPISGLAARSAAVDLSACGASVRFSANPSQLSVNELQKFAKGFGEYSRWDVSGWRYTKYRLVEAAMCLCRDSPLTAAEIEEDPSTVNLKSKYSIEDLGEAIEVEDVLSKESIRRVKMVRLKSPPNCLLMQMVMSPEPDNAAGNFFPSLARIPSVTPRSSVQPAGVTAAERLRQLDQLLKDRLITQEEYGNRRRLILESL